MPKLDNRTAQAVDSTDSVHGGDFEPLPAGWYLARLSGVEVRPETDKYDASRWSAEFDEIHGIEDSGELDRQPGRQWLNLSLPTTAKPHPKYENGPEKWEKYQNMLRGRLSAFFEAFGYTPDSDTEEMVGEWAEIKLSIRTIQQGNRAGQTTNQVDDIREVSADLDIPEVGDPEGDSTF